MSLPRGSLVPAIAGKLMAYLAGQIDRDAKVVKFGAPAEIEAAFERHGLALPEGQPALSPEDLLAVVDTVLERAVRTQHPRFFNQNFAGADPIAVVADWLVSTLNTSAATYEMAPVFTLMERATLARMAELAGFTQHDGVFGPGGSLNNLFALHLARHRHDPHSKARGARAQYAVFVSAQAHYSFLKGVALLGMGTDALYTVTCDEFGRMRPDALSAAIEAARADHRVPLFVAATAGTTVFGAFDPIGALADIAQAEELWLHVDGCHGASVLLSDTHRALMKGVHRADSLAWNPHKMLGVTQQCSALITQHPGLLAEAFSSGAEYIFQADKNFGEYDTGDKTFLCGRRADVVKLWLTWKARGDAGLAGRIDRAFKLAAELHERLESDPRFALAGPPSFTHVCFWWVPEAMRPFDFDRSTPEERAALHRVAPQIKDQMQREGTAMIGYQPLGERPNFFRWLFINPAVQTDDIDAVIELIDRYGRASG